MIRTLLSLLLVLCWSCDSRGAAAEASQSAAVGPLTLTLPAEWIKEARPDGTLAFLTVPEGRGRSEVQFSSTPCSNPPVAVADADAVHDAIWREIARQVTDTTGRAYGVLREFKWSEMSAIDAETKRRSWYRLYTTKLAADCVVVLIGMDSQPAFRQVVALMDAALSKAQHGATAPTAATELERVPILEAYVYTEIRPIALTSNVLTDHILLFKNGIAVRLGFSDGPRECYAALPVTNLTALPSNYGRWREGQGRAIDISWQEGPAWHLERNGERVSLAGKVLSRFRPIDGTRLEGSFVYTPVGDSPTVLRLSRDGKFEARNLRQSMLCAGSAAVQNGSGSYEVRKWTLLLRFDNGATALLPLKIAAADLQQVNTLTVRSYELTRTQ